MAQPESGAMLDNLEQLRRDIDRRLNEAVSNRRSPMHTPVVMAGEADARIMVLRDFEPATATARFHTDARAPKVGVIGSGAPVGVLFYDRDDKVQIRCRGTGWIEQSGPIADAAWAASTRFARRCYLGDGPGSPAAGPSSGLPPQFEGCEPEEHDLIPARAHFAVLLVRLDMIDWFHLAHTGHRRALFENGTGRWITP
ncbi:MAG: flavin-binding protein [Sphingomonadaceae bacterium]